MVNVVGLHNKRFVVDETEFQTPFTLFSFLSGYTYVFWVGHNNGTCIYTGQLNLEETGSGNSKMAAYTHEMRISQLLD